MVRRKRHSKEFREGIVLEVSSGQSSVNQIAQRESVHPSTIRNWAKQINTGSFRDQNKEELALRKKVAELEGALAEMALNNHILKKTQIIMKELQRKEKLSGSVSPLNLE
jgi:transposase-like protein